MPHLDLADRSFADRAVRATILVLAGTALLTASAKVNIPLPYVPMTLQTLVVLLIGSAYGWQLGTATVAAYLAEGALGLPVFAGPIGGLAPFVGPTAGYLFGFLIAAFITGWFSDRGWDRLIVKLFAVMALGHVVILSAGYFWLAYGLQFGAQKAFAVGVAPFIAGSIVKNAIGAMFLPLIRKTMLRRSA